MARRPVPGPERPAHRRQLAVHHRHGDVRDPGESADHGTPRALGDGPRRLPQRGWRHQRRPEGGPWSDLGRDGRWLGDSGGGAGQLEDAGCEGGEDITDPVRGPINNGGLYGERAGWSLPGYPDRRWTDATVPASSATPGTTWYRTTFRLHIPQADDASLGLTIGDPSVPRSSGDYRALIFVNGWNMGQYIANIGPQHTFVVPNGVLDPDGQNTLAIAVTSDGGAGNGLERVALTELGTVRGGVPLALDNSPGYTAPRLTPAHLRANAGHTVTGTIADLALPPDAAGTDVRATVRWGDGTTSTADVSGSGARRTVVAAHQYRWPGDLPAAGGARRCRRGHAAGRRPGDRGR